MKTTFENNVLTVVTDIKKETIEKGISDLIARDDKGNQVYAVSMAKTEKASINAFQFAGNAYVDGYLAAVIVEPVGATRDDMYKKYGESLLAAKKYTAIIAEEAAKKEADIAEIFCEGASETTEATDAE